MGIVLTSHYDGGKLHFVYHPVIDRNLDLENLVNPHRITVSGILFQEGFDISDIDQKEDITFVVYLTTNRVTTITINLVTNGHINT